VILIGAGPRIVLTVARSLKARGVPVVLAVPPGQPWSVHSRALADVVHLSGSTEACAAQIVALVEMTRACWIATCTDGALQILANARAALPADLARSVPAPTAIHRVLDKRLTLAAAAEAGIPLPHEYTLTTASDLAAVGDECFPLIAKPADRSGPSVHSFKTRLFETRTALEAEFAERTEFGKGLLFQQYCPGSGVGIELLLHDGRVVAAFQHRRLREFPAGGGVAVVARAEPLDTTLLDHAVRLLGALEWTGVAMVEFRHDATTGRTALMEVNGRFWGSVALPVRAGVDFPWLAYSAACGATVIAPTTPSTSTRIRWTTGELLRLRAVLADPKSEQNGGVSRLAALTQFVADFRPGVHSALWSSADPAPALEEPLAELVDWTRSGVGSVARAILPDGVIRALRTARNLDHARRREYLARQVRRATRLARPRPLPPNVRTVVFVCHGNIMRSPTAAEMLRRRLDLLGRNGITVLSAGVYARAGKRADPRMREAARAAGVSLDDHSAQPLTQELVDSADLIAVMDDANFVDVVHRFSGARGKTRLLGGVAPGAAPYVGYEIRDPYTGNGADVRAAVDRIALCIEALADSLVADGPANTSGSSGGQPILRAGS